MPMSKAKKEHGENIKRKLIEARKTIKRKMLALKLNSAESDQTFQKQFKTIFNPLNDILNHMKDKNIKSEDVPRNVKQETFKTEDPDPIQSHDFMPLAEDAESYHSADEEVNEPHNPIILKYLELMSSNNKIFDTHTGIQVAKINNVPHFTIGDTTLKIQGKDYIIGSKVFKGTKGLHELMFLKQPQRFTKRDLEKYQGILLLTNAAHRNFDSAQQIKGDKSQKYNGIVKPLLQGRIPYTLLAPSPLSTRAKSTKLTTEAQKQNTETKGAGVKNRMIVDDKPFKYVYYNDINELIERLCLLHASKAAGNNAHLNEIASIEEELREANVII